MHNLSKPFAGPAMSSPTLSKSYYRSSSFKVAALFAFLLGVSSLLLMWFLYDFSQSNLIRETESSLISEVRLAAALLENKSDAEIRQFVSIKRPEAVHNLYLYLAPDATILAGDLAQLPPVIQMKEGIIRFTLDSQVMAGKVHTFENGNRLLIARDIGEATQSYINLQWVAGLILFFMMLVILVSFLVSLFVVSRINRIGRTAGAIMETGDLSRRLVIDSGWDDLSTLATILNALLERVEHLMAGIRDVSDGIAHDLRTPLTRIRTHLDAAKTSGMSPEDVQMTLAEADHLLDLFHALLRIANIEKGKRHQAFETVALHTVLMDVVELYEPLAEEKQITLMVDIAPQAAMHGDRDLLFQLCANLLDNAIKYAPELSKIDVTLSNNPLILTIADHGPGIPESEREQVFERFYRSEKCRSTLGSGLGLSLVKAIADLHKATITLHDNHPGLRIVIRFPD